MNRVAAIACVCLAVSVVSASGTEPMCSLLTDDFGHDAFEHVLAVAAHGPHVAGSAAEKEVAGYIRDRFAALGLDVAVETFEFESFVVEEAILSCRGDEFSPTLLGLNPYLGDIEIEGGAVFVGPDDATAAAAGALELGDRLVVTTDPAPYFALMLGRPRAIAYLTAEDYGTLAGGELGPCRLRVTGDVVEHTSANVVATLGPTDPDVDEIVISAHYDSYRESPGADDNATGVGVMLELARYFAERGVEPGLRLRFVAFGAEEVGIVGSRAYLDAHGDELRRCVLLVNLDQVGGARGPVVEMTGGVSGVPDAGVPDAPVVNRFPDVLHNRAWEGKDGRWRLVEPQVIELFMASNRPEWLTDLMTESASATGVEIIPTGNMGGDSQVFTQAGVVATSIGTSGSATHGPGDTPDQVLPEQLTAVGRFAAELACRAAARHHQTGPHGD